VDLDASRPIQGLSSLPSPNNGHAHKKLARQLAISHSRIGRRRILPKSRRRRIHMEEEELEEEEEE
jgi:hypothetical protein